MSISLMHSLALAYARCHVVVFPCREADSQVFKAKSPYLKNGFQGATTSEEQISKWWQRWPNAVVGLPCRHNGIIAIDADRHGDVDGVNALADHFMIHGFDGCSTPNVLTPRNGVHCLFHRPDTLGDTKAKIGSAIDVRDNGYIIAAGSVLENGRSYRLLRGSVEELAVAICCDTLPEPPTWLIKMLAKPHASLQRQMHHQSRSGSEAVQQRLKGLIRTAAFAQTGERNAKLHWAACRVGEMIHAGMITEDAAFVLFTEAGKHAGLSAHETAATIRSGFASVKRGLSLGR